MLLISWQFWRPVRGKLYQLVPVGQPLRGTSTGRAGLGAASHPPARSRFPVGAEHGPCCHCTRAVPTEMFPRPFISYLCARRMLEQTPVMPAGIFIVYSCTDLLFLLGYLPFPVLAGGAQDVQGQKSCMFLFSLTLLRNQGVHSL